MKFVSLSVNFVKMLLHEFSSSSISRGFSSSLDGPGHAKTCLMPYANNKGAAWLNLTWSKIPEDTFSRNLAQIKDL